MPEKRTYKQVGYMRKLVKKLGRDRETVCKAYARAEIYGIVARKSNKNNVEPKKYAIALWRDGDRNGWF